VRAIPLLHASFAALRRQDARRPSHRHERRVQTFELSRTEKKLPSTLCTLSWRRLACCSKRLALSKQFDLSQCQELPLNHCDQAPWARAALAGHITTARGGLRSYQMSSFTIGLIILNSVFLAAMAAVECWTILGGH